LTDAGARRILKGDVLQAHATWSVFDTLGYGTALTVRRFTVGRTLGVLLVLLSTLGLPDSADAQERPPGSTAGQDAGGFQLQQNYPNPFNPETTIPFVLTEGAFVEGRSAVVSMRILNILQQPVAVPRALRHPSGDVAVANLEYTLPGRYEAFWDGRDRDGRQVASGVYLLQVTVNGQSRVMKMWVAK
jgi:hypothetical protein